jgi:seryl-tRNA synthetase
MLDIKLIRERPKEVGANIKRRHDPEKLKLLKDLIAKDKKLREVIKKVEGLKHERNVVSRELAKSKGKDKQKIQKMRSIGKEIAKLDGNRTKLEKETRNLLLQIPNLLDKSVPFGKDDDDNKQIRSWGRPPKFKFKPKNHLEILEGLELIDAERAAKVAGHGFFYYKGGLAMLDHALIKYTIDFMVKKGYTLIQPPFMLKRRPYEGVTDMTAFADVLYKIEGEDLHMIATSEHPMAAMYMNEVLDKQQLPIKLVGVSPCFRKEVGSHGKYTKGLFRMHQFNKVEQFIFCLPEQTQKLHEELQKNAEQLYQSLGLPYRVMNVCTGDIGDIAAKKYDTDLWMSDKKFREAGSNSNCTDYQARRLAIRYREKEGGPVAGMVHTLNNTAIATSRTMVAIMEVYQQKDGSVKLPKVLHPYMGGMKVLENQTEKV